jgi:hypothetical protein
MPPENEQVHWNLRSMPLTEPIEHGRLFNPGYQYDTRDIQIVVADWQHVCSARFGVPRQSTVGSWTGDSYRYDIYKRPTPGGGTPITTPVGKPQVNWTQFAMRWLNGGGQGWLVCEDAQRHGEEAILSIVALIPDEARRWDYCHFLYEVADRNYAAGAQQTAIKWGQAFVDKRLKTRRRRGKVTVEMMPPAQPVAEVPHGGNP